jgi:hypothetical protein
VPATDGDATQARRASALQETFFGWFGKFMAFTGANFLRLVAVAIGLMMWGMATVSTARRLSVSK